MKRYVLERIVGEIPAGLKVFVYDKVADVDIFKHAVQFVTEQFWTHVVKDKVYLTTRGEFTYMAATQIVIDETPEEVEEYEEALNESLQAAMNLKIIELHQEYELELSYLDEDYPLAERESWFKQEAEAREYLKAKQIADTTSTPINVEVPYLEVLAAARNIPLDILAGKIIENAEAFAYDHAVLTGKLHKLKDQLDNIDNTNDVNDIRIINWHAPV